MYYKSPIKSSKIKIMNYLGLDIGTTRIKCGVFDDKGNLIYTNGVDYGGIGEYIDIQAVKENIFNLLENAYRACPYSALAVSSLGESFVLTDKDDNVLFLPMLYTDERGKEQAERFAGYSEKIFKISGVYPQSMYSVYKLLWIKENEPEIYARADKALLINQYVNYLLTGISAIDYSQSARTGVFDIRNKAFSGELCNLFGINVKLFGKPVYSGELIGKVKRDLKEKLNFNTDVYVVAGGHDQVCAAIGSGVTESGNASDGMGSVECITAIYDIPSDNYSMGKDGYPNVPFLKDKYCTYLLNYTCGSLTRWWLENVYDKESVLSGQAFINAEKNFTEESTGLLVLPYFAGAATPFQDVSAKGGILNLSLSDGKGRIYQGIIESLCYEMCLNLERVKEYGIKIEKIICTGGGSASDKWLQIKADVTNIPVYPLKVKEAGILGAAMLAKSGITGENVNEIAKKTVKLDKPFLPRKKATEQYRIIYEKYKKLYKILKEIM